MHNTKGLQAQDQRYTGTNKSFLKVLGVSVIKDKRFGIALLQCVILFGIQAHLTKGYRYGTTETFRSEDQDEDEDKI